jgi:hypothetical protein
MRLGGIVRFYTKKLKKSEIKQALSLATKAGVSLESIDE